jgi:hypothetical protein
MPEGRRSRAAEVVVTSTAQAQTHAEREERRARIRRAQDAFTVAAAQLTDMHTDENLASAFVLAAIGLVRLAAADVGEKARTISEEYVRRIQEGRRP